MDNTQKIQRINLLIKRLPPQGEFKLEEYKIPMQMININIFNPNDEEESKKAQNALEDYKTAAENSKIELQKDEEALQQMIFEGFAKNIHAANRNDGILYRGLTDEGRKLKELGSIEEYNKYLRRKYMIENRDKILDEYWAFFKENDTKGVFPLDTGMWQLCKKLGIDYHSESDDFENEFLYRVILEKKGAGLVKGRNFHTFKGFANETLEKNKLKTHTVIMNQINTNVNGNNNQTTTSVDQSKQSDEKPRNNNKIIINIIIGVISAVIAGYILHILGWV